MFFISGCYNIEKSLSYNNWVINITESPAIAEIFNKIPFNIDPIVEFTMDENNKLDIYVDMDVPILNWFISGKVSGTYTYKENLGIIENCEIELIKYYICIFGIDIKIPTNGYYYWTIIAYKEFEDCVYLIPQWNEIPDSYRIKFENGENIINWDCSNTELFIMKAVNV